MRYLVINQACFFYLLMVQTVPVFTVEATEDYKLRSFEYCPAYKRVLDQWYDSEEFKTKEKDTEEFRENIHKLAPELNVSLRNWHDVRRAFFLSNFGVGDPMPKVDNGTYAKVY